MIKKTIKHLLLRAMPGPAGVLRTLWQRRYVRHLERHLGVPQVTRALVARHGRRVLGGPFEGMQYVPCAVGSALLPKMVGCYEAELNDVLAQIIHDNCFRTVIDVGCAEGYYAIGLAMRLPKASVVAFDTDRLARRLCRSMANLNAVSDRVKVAGECTPQTLEATLTSGALVISDCEGYEIELLRPDLVPGLLDASILVELHDFDNPDTSETVLARFQSSHQITVISMTERDPQAYEVTQFLPETDRRLAVSELRHSAQQWAFMTPRSTILRSNQPSMVSGE